MRQEKRQLQATIDTSIDIDLYDIDLFGVPDVTISDLNPANGNAVEMIEKIESMGQPPPPLLPEGRRGIRARRRCLVSSM